MRWYQVARLHPLCRATPFWAACGIAIGVFWSQLGHDFRRSNATSDPAPIKYSGLAAARASVRDNPARIKPAGDLQDCVADDQALEALVVRMLPQWGRFKLQTVAHALRLWGNAAVFDDQTTPHWAGFHRQTPSGQLLQDLLLDDRVFRREAPPGAEPILLRTEYGIAVRYQTPALFEGQLAHPDKLLRICAELGLPSATPVVLRDGEGQVRDLVSESMARVDEGREMEWTAEALTRYVRGGAEWTDRFGRKWTVNRITRVLLEKPKGQGVCFGTHVPYALMCVYRIDEDDRFLTRQNRSEFGAYFVDLSARLQRDQCADGSFSWRWAPNVEEPPDVETNEKRSVSRDKNFGMAVTGHHLEWIALAPPGLRPSRASITRAANFLLQDLAGSDLSAESPDYLPATHAARALCLLKNTPPLEFLARAVKRRGAANKPEASLPRSQVSGTSNGRP